MGQNQNITLAYKSLTWFNERAQYVPEAGIHLYLLQTGSYKIGDGNTVLSSLLWLGGGAPPVPVPIPTGSEAGIVAHVGGGQAAAYELTKQYCRIDSCATDLDSVKTTAATEEGRVQIENASTQEKKVNVYPKIGEQFRDGKTLLAVDAPLVLGRGNTLALYCFLGETGIYSKI